MPADGPGLADNRGAIFAACRDFREARILPARFEATPDHLIYPDPNCLIAVRLVEENVGEI
jgi:hypothetical protein